MPDADKAIVSREKAADYLLNPAHPDNGGKAEFFTRLGFRRDQWEIFAAALKSLAAAGDVVNPVVPQFAERGSVSRSTPEFSKTLQSISHAP